MNRLTTTAAALSTFVFMSAALAKPPAEVPADAKEAISHAKLLSKAFRAVSSAVSPAVVSIETIVPAAAGSAGSGMQGATLPPAMLEMLRQRGLDPQDLQGLMDPFNPRNRGGATRRPQVQGQGTGFVVAEDGYILTNNHVVGGGQRDFSPESVQLTVGFSDGRRVPGKLVGTDAETDLAVIKVELDDLTPLAFGDSDAAEVGDWVIALGSPFGLNDSVTAGIISAKGRQVGLSRLESYLQTDATINPGNSGGPLVDLEGKLVGINTAIESRSGGSDGIGFAIPSNMARTVLDAIMSGSTPLRGYLGVLMQPLDDDMAASFGFSGRGVLVSHVEPASPADTAGMQSGDIITHINGKETTNFMRAQAIIKLCAPGSECPINVVRDGEKLSFNAHLGDRTAALAAAGGGRSRAGAPNPRLSVPQPKAAPALDLGMAVTSIDTATAQERSITNTKGVLVTSVSEDGPGARAGLREGDIVRKVGDTSIADASQFNTLVSESLTAGRSVRLLVERGGDTRFVLLRRS